MKKILLLLIGIFVSLAAFSTNPLINGKLDGELKSYKNRLGNFEIYWKVISENEIYFGINAKANGWISIGFDNTFMMSGADIKIANIKDGVVTIEDHFGNGPTKHELDDKQEIIEFAGKEEGQWTFIEFIMPVNSGDEKDKPIKIGQENKVIIASSNRTDEFWKKHDFRESLKLVF
jgi:hypothetical protein